MFALLLTPAVLSLLVLAAHFLRRGQMLECALVLGALGTLLVVRRPWVPRVVQVLLALAVVVWGMTLVESVQQRIVAHEPAGRLVVILGSVMAVNVLGAVLLGTRRVTSRYAAAPAPAPDPAR